MSKCTSDRIFGTNKRIRLGLWGLGRGMSFFDMCRALNLDVVAGCDYNEHMRERFQAANPGAFVTDDADAFLDADFDAVLLATFCPSHAPDALRCLEAGKHVLSEVTSFHTMAEGVALVEAVERSGLVYNLAENYPFTPAQRWVARKWREGLFGDLMYAEGEYVHEVRTLCYTYIDGVPIQPGYALHNWRSWINFHYYCTHSLGPIMAATGTRPVRVVSLPGEQSLPGFPVPKTRGLGGIAPSLIRMDNGAVVRNLMGGTTNDVHRFRYWGTKAAAEIGHGLFLRLGGGGDCPKLEIAPDLDALDKRAAKTGHGGGDFWVLYYFARQLLEGAPAPFDIHSAADVTIPGILAYRSSTENGAPYDVPDFRKRADRDRWRRDTAAQPHFDPDSAAFPKKADKRIAGRFTAVMNDLLRHAVRYRAYADWRTVAECAADPARIAAMAEDIIREYPAILRTIAEAQAIAEAYPRSEGARLLREVLESAKADEIRSAGNLESIKHDRTRLRRLRRKTRSDNP